MFQRTSVGLDMHARSVVACGLDRETGEVVERRLTPSHRDVLGWIEELPGPVAVPSADQEAGRDLVRAREDCRGDLMAARHRISKLLLRQGIVYYDGKTWTGRHELRLRQQRFGNRALQLTYDAAFDAMTACVDRRDRLEAAIEEMAADSEFTPVVRRLGCIRGIATLTAFGLVTEMNSVVTASVLE